MTCAMVILLRVPRIPGGPAAGTRPAFRRGGFVRVTVESPSPYLPDARDSTAVRPEAGGDNHAHFPVVAAAGHGVARRGRGRHETAPGSETGRTRVAGMPPGRPEPP